MLVVLCLIGLESPSFIQVKIGKLFAIERAAFSRQIFLVSKDPSIPHPSSRYWRWGLLPVALFLVLALSHDLAAPWTLEDNYNGAIYSQAAHNYLRAGLVATACVPAVLYFGPLPIPPDGYYVHHPCLLPLTVAGMFSILGEKEWVARLVPIGASLLTLCFLWLLVRHCAGARTATLAAGIFATLPMELHYGEMVNFEPVALFWMVTALLVLRYWQQTGRPVWRVLLFVAIFFGLWTEWTGYFFALLIAFYFLGAGPKRGWPALVLALAALSGAVFLLQIHHVDPEAWSDAGHAFLFRLGRQGATGTAFTWGQWTSTVFFSLIGLIPLFQWALAIAGTIYFFRRQRHLEGSRYLAGAAGCLFVLDLGYMVGFRNASFIHDFAGFYFTAPVAMMGGVALNAFVIWMGGLVREMALARMGSLIVCMVLALLALTGYPAALKFDSQFEILDGDTPEPKTLIPDVGRLIGRTFPPDAVVLCNFDPYDSNVPYYAQRTVVTNLSTFDEWKQAEVPGHSGGVIWMHAPGASEILSNLGKESERIVNVDGVRFCLWVPQAPR